MHLLTNSDFVIMLNLTFSTALFMLIVRLYILPKLHKLSVREILAPLLIFHSFRHLGLMFLSPGATKTALPIDFAIPAAYGDLVSAILAVLALTFLLRDWGGQWWAVMTFNVVGFTDLVFAVSMGVATSAAVSMGAAYWIPALWVPALLVSHGLIFMLLLQSRKEWIDSRQFKTKSVF